MPFHSGIHADLEYVKAGLLGTSVLVMWIGQE
jgi:hypothetical protein